MDSTTIGERLKSARTARGLSLEQLASLLSDFGCDLTKAALSKYERGKSVPNALVLRALAKALDVENAFFFRESVAEVAWGDFRKTTKLGKKDQASVKATASSIVEEFVRLEAALAIQPRLLFTQQEREQVCNADEVEVVAERVRERLGLGAIPIEGLAWLLETGGVIVIGLGLGVDSKFDGLSAWVNSTRPLILINLDRPVDRTRYNLAHELGHLVLDCEGRDEKFREELAHRFAAAFLVPRVVAFRELGATTRRHLSLAELGLLKRKYGLSIQAWIRRAHDLDVINQNAYQSLFMELSSRGWRRQEPPKFDYRGSEEPLLLKQYTLRALSEGLIDKRKAQNLLPELSQLLDEAPFAGTARAVRRLPRAERQRLLAAAADKAVDDYATGSDLIVSGALEVLDDY